MYHCSTVRLKISSSRRLIRLWRGSYDSVSARRSHLTSELQVLPAHSHDAAGTWREEHVLRNDGIAFSEETQGSAEEH